MPSADARRHDGHIADYLRTGEGKIIGVGRETEALRKDGKTFPIDLAIIEAVVDGDLIFVGFVRDLSERREFRDAHGPAFRAANDGDRRNGRRSVARAQPAAGGRGRIPRHSATHAAVATPDDRFAPIADALSAPGSKSRGWAT